MELNELDNEKMKTMREIAECNILIGEMKAEMSQLESQKNDFFKLRESEVVDRVNKALEDSQGLLDQVKSNYTLVHEFYEILQSFADYLKDGRSQLEEVIKHFQEDAAQIVQILEIREHAVKEKESDLSYMRRSVENVKAQIEIEQKKLNEDQIKLMSDRGALQRSIERLKKGAI